MTLEELERKLKEAGIDEGQWGKIKGGKTKVPLLDSLTPLLLESRKIVSQELKNKVKERHQLHKMLGKLKHGGAI